MSRTVNRTPRTGEDVRRFTQKLVSRSNWTTIGVDTTDDIVVDDSGSGPVLKSPNGHYWRVTIDNAGSLTSTDLGTTKP